MSETVCQCPVCHGVRNRPLLMLKDAPIYLHPAIADADVPLPHTLNLDYRQCLACGHAFQVSFDMDMLRRIYENHYYTPAAEGVAVGARNDFMSFLRDYCQRKGFTPDRILEVGCSSGEVLLDVQLGLKADIEKVLGIEPNHDTAQAARKHGLNILEAFLDVPLAKQLGQFSLVYTRHVIEHVDDLPAFLASLKQAVAADGIIVIETPCLDVCLRNQRDIGFHVEHLHLFSMQSLAQAARLAGLHVAALGETSLGHMIAVCTLQAGECSIPVTDLVGDLQACHDERVTWWQTRLSGRKSIFWGAGSAARILMAETGLKPDALLDGNPGKSGKQFIGMKQPIQLASEFVRKLIESGEDRDYTLVAASMFCKEIRQDMDKMGWKGEFVSLFDDVHAAP
ncbi:class I SAM-dependent methyltransferase [Burkholderiaceae bacterium DAT-1]|nr:class I SAM-dependent methyltransferase [Burkholderiaceae bacterium DAT-1]